MEREEQVIAKLRWCDEAEENVARDGRRKWRSNGQSRAEWRKFIEEVRDVVPMEEGEDGSDAAPGTCWLCWCPGPVLIVTRLRVGWTSLLGSRQILLIFRAFKPVLGPP
jgi:hypothetical protein